MLEESYVISTVEVRELYLRPHDFRQQSHARMMCLDRLVKLSLCFPNPSALPWHDGIYKFALQFPLDIPKQPG